jgi:hypothetical protein
MTVTVEPERARLPPALTSEPEMTASAAGADGDVAGACDGGGDVLLVIGMRVGLLGGEEAARFAVRRRLVGVRARYNDDIAGGTDRGVGGMVGVTR